MTPYAGDKPKEDLDTAWEKLMKPMNMRFTKSELDLVNQDSVHLPEGGGYLGWFGVFHNLHCVVCQVMLRGTSRLINRRNCFGTPLREQDSAIVQRKSQRKTRDTLVSTLSSPQFDDNISLFNRPLYRAFATGISMPARHIVDNIHMASFD